MFSSKSERSGADLLPNSDEALAERLDMLASTVSATAAAIAKTDGELVNLRRSLENGLAHVEAVVADLRAQPSGSDVRILEKRVAELSAERVKTADAKRLDDLSSKVALLAQRVDTLGSTVASAAASVAGRDGEVAALRRQFGEVPHGQAVDEALLRRVEDAASASASASMRLESHRGQIDEVKRRVDEAGEQLSGVEQRLDGLDERWSAVTQRIDSVDHRLSGIAQRTDSADERLSEVTLRVEADENERMALATSVADAAAVRWRELDRALASLAERLDEVEERGSAVSAELARAASLWPAALRSLETKVEALASASPPSGADSPQHAGDDAHVLVALRTLEQRLQHADEAAREERETVLERLERLSGQLHERVESTPMPVGANIVPFRTDP
jgi:chromosome segregation ATPase